MLFLNKYGGRSFNDPSQYHVFPWIILDFKNLISINKSGQLINEKFKGKNELKIENDKISEEEKKLHKTVSAGNIRAEYKPMVVIKMKRERNDGE